MLRILAVVISIFQTGCNPAPITRVSLTESPSKIPATIPPIETTAPTIVKSTATAEIETISPPAGLLYQTENEIWLVDTNLTPQLLF